MKLKHIQLTALMFLMMFSLLSSGCGGSSSAPPITLPAPTGGYIDGTAPDASGNAIVYGYIYDGSEFLAQVTVVVTNKDNNETESTTTDAEAFFSVTIPASIGDEIGVTDVY